MRDVRFTYQLLYRLMQDCEYYLGYGYGNRKHLWADTEQEQIDKMKELYDSVHEKPEWLTVKNILAYV